MSTTTAPRLTTAFSHAARRARRISFRKAFDQLEARRLMASFSVINAADAGTGSLRWAIAQANSAAGPDTIAFDIAGGDTTIDLATPLPAITGRTFVDATTQPGYAGAPLVTINGSQLLAPLGLDVRGAFSEVKGLSMINFAKQTSINNTFDGTAIKVDVAATNVIIEDNYFGLAANGTTVGRNGFSDVSVGGVSATVRDNVFAAPRHNGSTAFPLSSPGASSVDVNANGANVYGNRFNVNLAGDAPLVANSPEIASGIHVNADNVTIGGAGPLAGNMFGSYAYGVRVASGADSTTLLGNAFGLTADRSAPLGHLTYGVYAYAATNLNVGTADLGNAFGAMQIGVSANFSSTVNVRNNLIGTSAAGADVTADIGAAGVSFSSVQLGTVSGNSIGHQYGSAITLGRYVTFLPSQDGGPSDSISIFDNGIGTLRGNTSVNVGNRFGITLEDAIRTSIGATAAGKTGNTIRFNDEKGVVVKQGDANAIGPNFIADNGGLEVDLGNDGATANDSGDMDAGPNNLQNKPVISSVTLNNQSTARINFSLTPYALGGSYRVDFYASGTTDATGTGEAREWLGSQTYTSPNGQNINTWFGVPLSAVSGKYVSATATAMSLSTMTDTSELSVAALSPAFDAPSVTAMQFEYEVGHDVHVNFSENVGASIDASDLSVVSLSTGQAFTPTSVFYSAANNSALFRFSTLLPDSNYVALLSQTGVTDATGLQLTAAPTLPFHVLAGDANRDKKVDFSDLLILAANYNTTGKTFSQGNFNYSLNGAVNFDDLLILASKYNSTLAGTPAPLVVPGNGVGNDDAGSVGDDVLA